jgi:polyisoprenoid-binding protein YceI
MPEIRSLGTGSVAAILAGVLCACASGPQLPGTGAGDAASLEADAAPSLATRYAEFARNGERVVHIDPAASTVHIYAFRGGVAARLGHNHVLTAPEFTAYAHYPPGESTQGGFDLQFRLDRLRLDDAAERAQLGSAFAKTLDEADIASTREHMLGAESLQAERYPYVRLHGLRLVGEGPARAAQVEVTMHGRQREFWLPLHVEEAQARLVVSGSFVLRQSDFDVTPYSVLGGAIAVQDEVVVEFRLVGSAP